MTRRYTSYHFHDLICVKQVEKLECSKANVPETDCPVSKRRNMYGIQQRQILANSTRGSRIVYCDEDECNQGYFVLENYNYTATQLVALYS